MCPFVPHDKVERMNDLPGRRCPESDDMTGAGSAALHPSARVAPRLY